MGDLGVPLFSEPPNSVKKTLSFWGSFVGTPKKSGQIRPRPHTKLGPQNGGLGSISGKSPCYFREEFPRLVIFFCPWNFGAKKLVVGKNPEVSCPYSQPITLGNLPKNAWVRTSWCSNSVRKNKTWQQLRIRPLHPNRSCFFCNTPSGTWVLATT